MKMAGFVRICFSLGGRKQLLVIFVIFINFMALFLFSQKYMSISGHQNGITSSTRSDFDPFEASDEAFRPKNHQDKRPQFLSEYKNPCWHHRSTSGEPVLKCVPRFYIVGFGKSGTTNFCKCLAAHPQIASPAKKELGFWDNLGTRNMSTKQLLYLQADILQSASDVIENTLSGNRHHKLITYDCTPRNVWYTWLPNKIQRIYPETKIIFIMREPVQRLYSHYHHNCLLANREFSARTFHDVVRNETITFKGCLKKYDTEKCITKKHMVNIPKSMYVHYVKHWAKYFPMNQMHFIESEDFNSNTISVMKKVFQFLEVSEMREDVRKIISSLVKENALSVPGIRINKQTNTSLQEDYQKWTKYRNTIWHNTKTMLEEFYAPYNRQLAELLGNRKFAWVKH